MPRVNIPNVIAMPWPIALHLQTGAELSSWQAFVTSRRRPQLLTLVASYKPQREEMIGSCTAHRVAAQSLKLLVSTVLLVCGVVLLVKLVVTSVSAEAVS